jgi:soluble lytic murein transglycosylase-like protein
MRVMRAAQSACFLMLFAVPVVRAEYIVLKTGQQFHVTSYQLLGDRYRLQIAGGFVDVAADEVARIDPEDQFAAIPAPPTVVPVAPYREIVKAAAARYAVDEELIASVIAAESNFDPKAISKKNARGLMQLLPETAARFGVKDIFDPRENVDAGTHYLSELLKQYNNDLALALAAYNAGPERVTQFGRIPPYTETMSYVRRVKNAYEKSKSGQAPGPKPTPQEKASSLPQNIEKATAPAELQAGVPN